MFLGKKQQGKCLRKSPTQPRVKLYCCYAVIMVLSVAVIALSFALSVKKENEVTTPPAPCFATCPNDWIGFGSKCFYFSDVERNWTLSQNYCMAHEAQLAGFETLEELHQGKCLRIISTEPPVKLYCCYVVIMVLTAAVIALSVALSGASTYSAQCRVTHKSKWSSGPYRSMAPGQSPILPTTASTAADLAWLSHHQAEQPPAGDCGNKAKGPQGTRLDLCPSVATLTPLPSDCGVSLLRSADLPHPLDLFVPSSNSCTSPFVPRDPP
ncbi:C-type lectin domain family 2 member H [Microtus ochrogaster]|uniref:C-type lectin domain family 2 member H n=1 Tax=Microtus ochrogaster TaxID=79684 RepID=A0A8J6G7J9_MICOH|nr:C-type lectin domain family 2 member H [Microtus ochrogaster]